MAYCGPKAIPYDVWLGLDAPGVWSEHSRLCALAWQGREARRCDGCGQVRDDWVDEDGVELRPLPAYVEDRFCPSCDLLHEHRADGGDDPHRQATMRQVFVPTGD